MRFWATTVLLLATGATAFALNCVCNPRDGSTAQPTTKVVVNKKKYSAGSQVQISFTVQNESKQNMILRFSSGQQYDMWITQNKREVWRWSRDKVFTQALKSTTLMPGEQKVFKVSWNQTNNEGKPVVPGVYELHAQLTTIPTRREPVKISFTVTPAPLTNRQVKVADIVKNVDSLAGSIVTIKGIYRGWRGDPDSPACAPGVPVTRSDWVVSDDTGSIFVTGPSGLVPTEDYGKEITVTGVVQKTDKGQPYIEVARDRKHQVPVLSDLELH